MMKEHNMLCVQNTKQGTLDVWVNYEGEVSRYNDTRYHIITTYNGESPEEGMVASMSLKGDTIEQALDELMKYISRDTQNWSNKDIVIHWGVHTWKFMNEHNITTIEKDENTKNLDDIKLYYDVEW